MKGRAMKRWRVKHAVHSDDPQVFDTFECFGQEECELQDIEQPRIDERNLEQCKILRIRWSAVHSLGSFYLSNLQVLDMWESDLLELNTEPLQKLEDLSLIVCATCKMDTSRLKALRSLQLIDSSIDFLNTSGLLCLEQLGIGDQEAKFLDRATLRRLKGLSVSEIDLQLINAEPLPKMEWLKLEKCEGSLLSTKQLPSLGKLSVTRTGIVCLNLVPLRMLRCLHFYHCPLGSLDFSALSALTELTLQCESISCVDSRFLPSLGKLDISGSRIRYIDLRHMSNLKCLSLGNTVLMLDLVGCLRLNDFYSAKQELRRISFPRNLEFRQLAISQTGVKFLDLRGKCRVVMSFHGSCLLMYDSRVQDIEEQRFETQS